MKSGELMNQIFGIRGLINIRELQLYQVKILLDRKLLPYTGCSEDTNHNRVFVYSNRGKRDYSLFSLLSRLKKFNQCRNLQFTYGYNLYSVVGVYIDSINYVFTLIVR